VRHGNESRGRTARYRPPFIVAGWRGEASGGRRLDGGSGDSMMMVSIGFGEKD
jgi:hypothetical protein